MDERVEGRNGGISRRDRVLVVTDSSSAHARFLTAALLAAARNVEEFSIAAVVDTGSIGGLAFAWSCVAWLFIRLFNPGYRKPMPSSPWALAGICRRAAVPFRKGGDTAASDWNVRANVLVSIYYLKKFSREFLDEFDYGVNYHNGPLPAYRGVLATNWELYRGEATFGFTFHRLSEGIDEGNILAAGSVHGDGSGYKFQLERLKAHAAATHWPDVIEKVQLRDEGTPQFGPAGNYTRQKCRAIREVGDPAVLTRSDLERRIRCFESVRIRLAGRELPVSAVTSSRGGSRFDVVTADGAMVRATRFDHLPYPLYRLGRVLSRSRIAVSAALSRHKRAGDS